MSSCYVGSGSAATPCDDTGWRKKMAITIEGAVVFWFDCCPKHERELQEAKLLDEQR